MSDDLIKELSKMFAAVTETALKNLAELLDVRVEPPRTEPLWDLLVSEIFSPPAVCEICKATVPGAVDVPGSLCQSCAVVLGWDGCAPKITRTFTIARSRK